MRLRQISVPRLPEREMTPTLPGLKMLVLWPGMMPTKPSLGVTTPAVFGPMIRQRARLARAWISSTCWAGICSVSTTTTPIPASMASTIASRANIGGTKITETSQGVVLVASTAVP